MTFCCLETWNKQGDFNSPEAPNCHELRPRSRRGHGGHRKGHPASHHAGPLPRSWQKPPRVLPPTRIQTRQGTDLKVNQHS
uniref:Uncharacterized protein n=2 Tax=Ursus TaxID=9639 RepID=A0A452VFP1_URSMA